MDTKRIVVDYITCNALDGSTSLDRLVIESQDRFSYSFNPVDAPGFLKMYYGHRTILIPVNRVVRIDLDL